MLVEELHISEKFLDSVKAKEHQEYLNGIANDSFSGKKTEGEMEIHFLTDFCPEGCLMTYDETEDAIRRRELVINTTSMAHLSFWLNDAGYKVFVHRNGKKIEFKPGMDNPMGKDIRKENNVFKMFKAKFFDDMF